MAENVLICICCPVGCRLTADITGENVSVSGNRCKRGADYAVNELLHPMRTLTTTVRVKEAETPLVPVRTKGEIPKEKIRDCMDILKKTEVTAPIEAGAVIIENIAGTGTDIIASKGVRSLYPFHATDKMI